MRFKTKSRVDIFVFVPFCCFINFFVLFPFAEPTGETVRLSQKQSDHMFSLKGLWDKFGDHEAQRFIYRRILSGTIMFFKTVQSVLIIC